MTTAFKMRQHHTHTHENSSSLCTSVAPTHTTAALQAAGPLTVVAVGGRDDRAVTSVLKASSYEFMKHRHLGAGVVEENHGAKEGRKGTGPTH